MVPAASGTLKRYLHSLDDPYPVPPASMEEQGKSVSIIRQLQTMLECRDQARWKYIIQFKGTRDDLLLYVKFHKRFQSFSVGFNPVGNRVRSNYLFQAIHGLIRGIQLIGGVQVLQVLVLAGFEQVVKLIGQPRMAFQKLVFDHHSVTYGIDPRFSKIILGRALRIGNQGLE